MKYHFAYILLFCLSNNIFGQFYMAGNDHPFSKLKQIETDHFKVIFPYGFEKEGNKLALLLEKSYAVSGNSLDHYPNKKIPVLLHTGDGISNAFVAWAPSRSEFNLIPPQKGESIDWLTHLALHEGRHMVQLDKLNSEVPKILKLISGEAATGLYAGLFPIWAYEGDAVISETALTNSGRGRNPSFLMDLKAISMENEQPFSYEKAIFGSYKDHVPSYYVYGYGMSAYARYQYDSLFWKRILEYIPKRPYTLYPTYFAMRKYYGLSKKKLYSNSMEYFSEQWKNMDSANPGPLTIKTNPKKEYTHYRFPVVKENGNIICLKNTMGNVDEIVEIDPNGNETKLTTPGSHDMARLSYGGGKLVWAELQSHYLWNQIVYSKIVILELKSGTKTVIGRNNHFMAPDISPDGTKIVAIETGLPNQEKIVIFDVPSGTKEREIAIDEGSLQMPKWSPDMKTVVFTQINDQGKSMRELDITTGKTKNFLSPQWANISSPIYYENNIIFTSPFNGTDNLFLLDRKNGNIYQLSKSKYGAFDPSMDANNGILYYNNYSSHGMDVAYVKISELQPEIFDLNLQFEPEIVKSISEQENNKLNTDFDGLENHLVDDYKRWKHPFNFHSWLPIYADITPEHIDHTTAYPGLTLFTQNLTGTLFGFAGYSYRKGYHYGSANFTYRGIWPEINFEYEVGEKINLSQDRDTDQPDRLFLYEQNYALTSRLPLFFQNGPIYFHLQPHFYMGYSYLKGNESPLNNFFNFRYATSLFAYKKMAYRDIYPKWGILGQGRYYHAPFENDFGSMYNTTVGLYLPGILPNNSLRITWQFQQQFSKTYRLPYSLSFPRGYQTQISSRFNMLAFNYTFPFLYPDWQIGSLTYIKRLRGNLFYDRAFMEEIIVEQDLKNEFFQSYGVEVFADLNAFQIIFPFSAGIRITYKSNSGEILYEPVFSFDIGEF